MLWPFNPGGALLDDLRVFFFQKRLGVGIAALAPLGLKAL